MQVSTECCQENCKQLFWYFPWIYPRLVRRHSYPTPFLALAFRHQSSEIWVTVLWWKFVQTMFASKGINSQNSLYYQQLQCFLPNTNFMVVSFWVGTNLCCYLYACVLKRSLANLFIHFFALCRHRALLAVFSVTWWRKIPPSRHQRPSSVTISTSAFVLSRKTRLR